MKKLIPILIALILIIVIGGVTVGGYLKEKYSYSTERVDLAEYYGVPASGEHLVIYLHNEKISDKALYKNGVCYFHIDTVKTYMNDTFYVDDRLHKILYTDANGVVTLPYGESVYQTPNGEVDLGHAVVLQEEDGLYMAEDFVRNYANYSLVVAQYHVLLQTEYGKIETAVVNKDSAIRIRGGIKSEIIWDVAKGSKVTVLEKFENWSKVVTADGYAGYIENKQLEDYLDEMETPVNSFKKPMYDSYRISGKVALGWHSIGGVGGNDTLESQVSQTKGLNVIAPTWFSLCDNEGNFENFGSASYVERAHKLGLLVWGVLDDFNYSNVNQVAIDDEMILANEESRRKLIYGIVGRAVELGMDGINLDFEKLPSSAGEAYGQFLRELAIECKRNQLTLSVDNYVPFNFNNYYRRDVQGEVADYVVIMGYDEHWHGSSDPGSVASINYVSNGIEKTLSQVPKEKVINALPFYSIVWRVDGASVSDEYLTLANTQDFLDRIKVPGVWDEETSQNYYEWNSGTATYKLWAETPESLAVKMNVMDAKDIAGVGVWQIAYGTPEAWAMIEAYVNAE